ncbi:MAG: low molecular weight protein-tyrosine-phosphatase [Pseudomonadota bacterium]
MKVLFVCLGNICRSPTAEGVFRKLLEEQGDDLDVVVDSAGTQNYHVGEPPDTRSQAAALARGIDISGQRARQVIATDFAEFDLVLAMDESNLANLRAMSSSTHHERVRLFLEFSPDDTRTSVPDPYYGGANGFEEVLDIVEDAAAGLLQHVRRVRGSG